MSLLRDQKIVTDDYATLADDAPVPAAGKVIVSLARWQKEEAQLKSGALQVGVRIPNTADLAIVWPSVKDRLLIALEFPAFADGRAYSQAKLLRARYGYRGEIRALGAAVVRDQLQGMHRCGINSFALREGEDPQLCATSFDDFTASYQKLLGQAAFVRSARQLR